MYLLALLLHDNRAVMNPSYLGHVLFLHSHYNPRKQVRMNQEEEWKGINKKLH